MLFMKEFRLLEYFTIGKESPEQSISKIVNRALKNDLKC